MNNKIINDIFINIYIYYEIWMWFFMLKISHNFKIIVVDNVLFKINIKANKV